MFAVYTMVYTQFTSANDCNEVGRVIQRQERAITGPGQKLVRAALILSRQMSWKSSECF